jgi:hypothetical protein
VPRDHLGEEGGGGERGAEGKKETGRGKVRERGERERERDVDCSREGQRERGERQGERCGLQPIGRGGESAIALVQATFASNTQAISIAFAIVLRRTF